jgi:phospholipid/cholesterol/gamma-HCH transport system substrate-binding protein
VLKRVSAVTISLLLVLAVVMMWQRNDDYTVRLVMGDAASLTEGSAVVINGENVGSVSHMEARGDKALVDVTVNGHAAPLHSGTKARVEWMSVLGRRQVSIQPGPAKNAKIPDGGMVTVDVEQVDLDDVLSALDEPTRKHVQSLLKGLDSTLDGHEKDLNDSLRDFSPAAQALGELAKGLGSDGTAIKSLVTDLHKVVEPMSARDSKLTSTVDNLTRLSQAIASEQKALGQSLAQLPETLQAANGALEQVGPAVDEARPMLRDLRPVAARLPAVSRKLAPTLTDLRPAIASLRPVLGSVNEVLKTTPSLLDSSHDVAPGFNDMVQDLNPALEFLRPYTPDLMGWVANWGSGFSTVDSVGGYAAAIVKFGYSSFDENPGIPLTIDTDPAPAPGKSAKIAGIGQPWTDANGSAMR